MPRDPEDRLPLELLERAIKSGNEYAWRRADVARVIDAARAEGLACLGGQVQFLFPDGTCELYWRNYGSTDRRPSEAWVDYVDRSASECLSMSQQVPCSEDLEKDALASFAFLREKARLGADLRAAEVFVLGFHDDGGVVER
jgi:hypothetical protein